MREQKRKRLQHIRRTLKKHAPDILGSDSFRATDANIQHGDVSVYEHSIRVAEAAVQLSQTLRMKVSERELVRGALLHDYFQYDWHKDGKEAGNVHPRLHGFFHPKTALDNASRDFDLSPKECDIIRKHMWPLTVVPPRFKESWLVTAADKYASLMETLHIHRGGMSKKHYIDLGKTKVHPQGARS